MRRSALKIHTRTESRTAARAVRAMHLHQFFRGCAIPAEARERCCPETPWSIYGSPRACASSVSQRSAKLWLGLLGRESSRDEYMRGCFAFIFRCEPSHGRWPPNANRRRRQYRKAAFTVMTVTWAVFCHSNADAEQQHSSSAQTVDSMSAPWDALHRLPTCRIQPARSHSSKTSEIKIWRRRAIGV